jgi:hypothetical protein
MKHTFFGVVLTLITTVAFSQEKENYIKDGVFYTKMKSGVGEQIPVKFKFGSDFEKKILETEVYKIWEKDTYTNPENEKYVERWKKQTHLETYLMSATSMASFYAQLELKNKTSFTPISGSEGFIYVNDKSEVNYSFPFKAQNGAGNMIFAKAFYVESVKDGKKESEHFISTN